MDARSQWAGRRECTCWTIPWWIPNAAYQPRYDQPHESEAIGIPARRSSECVTS